MTILVILLVVLLFSFLVIIHEWGHFVLARRAGVEVEEFALFFGPALYRRKTKAGWVFRINLLPLGGYVKMKGEHDDDTEKGSFGAARLWDKSKIMAAGVVMNLVFGMVLLTVVAWLGMPQLIPNQFTVKRDTKTTKQEVLITYIEAKSPAAAVGLKTSDRLMSIGQPGKTAVAITSPDELKATTHRFAGQKVVVTYARSGVTHQGTTTLLSNETVAASQNTDNPKGQLGVVPTAYTLQRSTWSAPVVAVGLTAQVTALTFQGLGHALAGLGSIIAGVATGNTPAREHGQTAASSQVSGPIGIYFILKEGTLLGYQFVLFVTALISLSLGIMNILPIPALDGGRLWLTLFTRGLLKRPLTPRREEIINGTGFVALILLFVLISIVDIKRFF